MHPGPGAKENASCHSPLSGGAPARSVPPARRRRLRRCQPEPAAAPPPPPPSSTASCPPATCPAARSLSVKSCHAVPHKRVQRLRRQPQLWRQAVLGHGHADMQPGRAGPLQNQPRACMLYRDNSSALMAQVALLRGIVLVQLVCQVGRSAAGSRKQPLLPGALQSLHQYMVHLRIGVYPYVCDLVYAACVCANACWQASAPQHSVGHCTAWLHTAHVNAVCFREPWA